MNITKAKTLYFSPRGTTEKIAKAIGEGTGVRVQDFDIITAISENTAPTYGEDELLIFAMPVYGGRIPEVCADWLNNLPQCKNPVIAAVVYGNREYEDALLELTTILKKKGMTIIGAGAFVAQHSLAISIAKGRPTKEDLSKCKNLGKLSIKKLTTLETISNAKEILVSGNKEYRIFKRGGILIPTTAKKCVDCKLCAKRCPVGAIPMENPRITDKDKCISCMHCTHICKASARNLPAIKRAAATAGLKPKCKEYKKSELFV